MCIRDRIYPYFDGIHPAYDLLPSFCDGMLQAADTRTVIYEGGEAAYGYTKESDFVWLKNSIRSKLKERRLSQVPGKLATNYRIAFGLFLDYQSRSCSRDDNRDGKPDNPEYCWDDNVRRGNLAANYFPPNFVNQHSPGWQQVLTWALTHSEGLVWVYSEEGPDFWTDQDLPREYVEATRDALGSGSR